MNHYASPLPLLSSNLGRPAGLRTEHAHREVLKMASPLWLEILKVVVAAGVFGVGIFTAWTGFEKAHQDRKDALEQAKKELEQAERDLQWHQTVEAQAAVRRMGADPQARAAMIMLDWNGRHFEIRERLRERISWDEMRLALRTEPGGFKPKEVFVRDSFDAFFDHFQMIQQEIDNKIFEASHVVYPLGYYSRRMRHPKNWPTFHSFLEKYDYPLAKRLIETTFGQSKPSGEVDIDATLRVEEQSGDEEFAAEALTTTGA
jgi:hypothetical protein